MTIIIAIPKELKAGENRVAMVPAVAEKLIKLGSIVRIQKDLGTSIYLADSAYKNVEVLDSPKDLYRSGIILQNMG